VDVALLDLGLPDSQGLRTFSALKDAAPNLAIVVLSGNGDQELATAAVQSGAQDYLIKGQFGTDLFMRATLYAVERQRAQRDLQASELRFRSVFDQVMDGILVIDPDSTAFLMANRAMWEVMGYTQAELLGFRFGDIYLQKAGPLVEELVRKMNDCEGHVVHDIPLRHSEGRDIFFDVNFAPINIDGRRLLMGSFRDVTEKRALQASVAQADRLASMGMLAAGVAHEINNPLAYVLYNIESLTGELPKIVRLMKRCCSTLRNTAGNAIFDETVGEDAELLWPATLEETINCARDAHSGTLRIKEIAKGLGSFSRVESNDHTEADLNYSIDCAINMAFNEVKYRAKLVKDLGSIPSIWASEGKLSQVFLNLLINSAHAIGEGGVENNRIAIRTWTEGGDVFAEVSDTGKGIAPENLERIFEPFFTTKPVGVGSGLGLAICKTIITDFGGTISVESEVGQGTRFLVRLPARDRDRTEEEPSAASRRMAVRAIAGRILVVDDDDSIRRMLQRMLGREHEVVATASAEEARKVLESDSCFDVIICDVMMPNMSGAELHEWLALENPELSERMMFLTGGAFTFSTSEYLRGVPNLRLEKPVDAAALKSLVMTEVAKQKAKPAKKTASLGPE
jgi:PAS domain S-box-containing protein